MSTTTSQPFIGAVRRLIWKRLKDELVRTETPLEREMWMLDVRQEETTQAKMTSLLDRAKSMNGEAAKARRRRSERRSTSKSLPALVQPLGAYSTAQSLRKINRPPTPREVPQAAQRDPLYAKYRTILYSRYKQAFGHLLPNTDKTQRSSIPSKSTGITTVQGIPIKAFSSKTKISLLNTQKNHARNAFYKNEANTLENSSKITKNYGRQSEPSKFKTTYASPIRVKSFVPHKLLSSKKFSNPANIIEGSTTKSEKYKFVSGIPIRERNILASRLGKVNENISGKSVNYLKSKDGRRSRGASVKHRPLSQVGTAKNKGLQEKINESSVKPKPISRVDDSWAARLKCKRSLPTRSIDVGLRLPQATVTRRPLSRTATSYQASDSHRPAFDRLLASLQPVQAASSDQATGNSYQTAPSLGWKKKLKI